MSNPFDYVNAISFTKKDLFRDDDTKDEANRVYAPWLINKALSYHPDAILHANTMNALELDHKLCFDYYINSLRKRKRFAKWSKPKENENLDLICEYYQCNKQIGQQYLKNLSKEQIKSIKDFFDIGGIKKKVN